MVHVRSADLQEATEWFIRLPRVLSTGIGVLSLSNSGEFALEMARHSPAICYYTLPYVAKFEFSDDCLYLCKRSKKVLFIFSKSQKGIIRQI